MSVVDASTVVLGIETSCDETAAALVMGGNDVISSVVSSQIEIHADFGGVVPEIASRAHLEALNPVIARAIVEAGLDERRIDAVACTYGPGLIGALLIGVSAAKALALAWEKPFVAVNHLEAHLYSAFLEDPTLEFPLVVLLVPGGHTMLIEMQAHGIAVNVLSPSEPVVTPGNLYAAAGETDWASPEDFAEATIRVALADAATTTGQLLWDADVLHPELGRRGWLR